ncbi:hypothetical protein Tco_1516387 [Tanacetum coccineum]
MDFQTADKQKQDGGARDRDTIRASVIDESTIVCIFSSILSSNLLYDSDFLFSGWSSPLSVSMVYIYVMSVCSTAAGYMQRINLKTKGLLKTLIYTSEINPSYKKSRLPSIRDKNGGVRYWKYLQVSGHGHDSDVPKST